MQFLSKQLRFFYTTFRIYMEKSFKQFRNILLKRLHFTKNYSYLNILLRVSKLRVKIRWTLDNGLVIFNVKIESPVTTNSEIFYSVSLKACLKRPPSAFSLSHTLEVLLWSWVLYMLNAVQNTTIYTAPWAARAFTTAPLCQSADWVAKELNIHQSIICLFNESWTGICISTSICIFCVQVQIISESFKKRLPKPAG